MTMSLIVDRRREPHPRPEPDTDVNHMHISKKRRTVRFLPTCTLRAYDLPQEQSAISSWYTSHDKQIFKSQANQEIMMFRRMKAEGRDVAKLPSGSSMCPVGLERQLISRVLTKKRAITRELVKLAVLTEQARAKIHTGSDKWERIARASRLHSEWSKTQAQTIGSFQAISKRIRD